MFTISVPTFLCQVLCIFLEVLLFLKKFTRLTEINVMIACLLFYHAFSSQQHK